MDPWDDLYIYLHEWLIFMVVNVAKYTSPMDPMGNGRIVCFTSVVFHTEPLFHQWFKSLGIIAWERCEIPSQNYGPWYIL